ncbi:MAG: hypothetical protein QXH30_01515 [Candidatus Bilamarchaeaceae archaeon]
MAKRERKKRGAASEQPPSGDAGKPNENAAPAPEGGKVLTHETPTVDASASSPSAKLTPQAPAEQFASLQGIQITPLHSKEIELIAKLGELDFATLRDMALERRWQAEVIQAGMEIKDWNEYEWYEKITAEMLMDEIPLDTQKERIAEALALRMREAEALEEESDRRNPYLEEEKGKGTEEQTLTPAEKADTLVAAGGMPSAKPDGAAEKALLANGQKEAETAIIPPEEDYSKYGDIFSAIGQVYAEAGEEPISEALECFRERLDQAIELAERIALAEGAGSQEKERAQKLKDFKNEFLETADGKARPKKDFDGYRLWLERRKADFKDAEGAFEALGIFPGECGRKAVLRIGRNALRGGKLDSAQEGRVLALMRMLEAKEPEEREDRSVAEKNADLIYDLVVGFALKREKSIAKARVDEIMRLEAELKGKKLQVAEYEDRQAQLAKMLSFLHAISKREGEATGEVTRRMREQLDGIASAYDERRKIISGMFGLVANERQSGADLMRMADKEADSRPSMGRLSMGTGRRTSAREIRDARKHFANGIGISIAAAAGAAIFAAGMFASQWLGERAGSEKEREGAAVVQAEKPEKTSEKAPAAEEDAGVPDGGAVALGRDAGMEKADGERTYYRNREGLKKALDEWCREERGLLVDGKMLRAAYAAIEGQLDGSVLPMEEEWVPLMLRAEFPNRLVELAIMSDLARTELDPSQKYAVLMRLSIPLGERARSVKGFSSIVEDANENGIGLPKIDGNSYLGKIEGARTGKKCLSASYFGRVAEMMEEDGPLEEHTREIKGKPSVVKPKEEYEENSVDLSEMFNVNKK